MSELKSHRVQVIIRGSRFESTLPVWTTYSAAIYYFYALPLNLEKMVLEKETRHANNDSECFDSHVNNEELEKRELEQLIALIEKHKAEHCKNNVYVSDIINLLDVKAHEALTKRLFTLHYTQTVYPILVNGVMSDATWQGVDMETNECNNEKANSKTSSEYVKEQELDKELYEFMPSPFCIQTIHFDAERQLWQFHFTRRLADDVIEYYNNLQTQSSNESNSNNNIIQNEEEANVANNEHIDNQERILNTSSETVDMVLDPNTSPFLLLQPEYMGVVLVYLRRCYQAYTTSNKNASPTVLPLRWKEMDFDAQLSLCQLIRSLGLVPFIYGEYKYDFPTASLLTSLFVKLQKLHNTAKSESISMNNYDKCEGLAESKGSDSGKKKSYELDKNNNIGDDDDSELLLLSNAGCVCCGRSGHNADTCPFMIK